MAQVQQSRLKSFPQGIEETRLLQFREGTVRKGTLVNSWAQRAGATSSAQRTAQKYSAVLANEEFQAAMMVPVATRLRLNHYVVA